MEQLKDMLLTYLEYDTPPSESQSGSHVYKTANPHPQNLGYVQGMSDLLSPLYAVFQDDQVAFWAFVKFMERMSRNFVTSQSGMRSQLSTLDQLVQLLDPKLYLHLQSADSTNFFFFFRMLLVWYKREFDWPDVLRLWEGLWTDYLSSQFHLFIAVAILEKHRDVIMEHLKHFDEVLKYINELSGTIELKETLVRAEGLYRRFERTVGVVDRQAALPAPNEGLRNRKGKSSELMEDEAVTSEMGRLIDRNQPSRSTKQQQGMSSPSGEESKKVISPQLRQLLDRKLFWYPPE
jgi:TBC1 domain family member 15